jgi:hypothetical protein
MSMPQTVRRPVWANNPTANARKVAYVGAVKHPRNRASSTASEAGTATVAGRGAGVPTTGRHAPTPRPGHV